MQDSKVLPKVVEWSNKDNNAFYEAVKTNGLKELARKAGLVNSCDMEVLTPYWSQAESILEVGAGYGRVIDYLLEHQFKGAITAVERCNALFGHLEKKFNQHKNVHLIHQDILELDTVHRFDLILLLWGGCANFFPSEQFLVVKKLSTMLKRGGKLVVDTVFADFVPSESKEISRGYYSINAKGSGSSMNFHLPSAQNITGYAQDVGFYNISHINYQTDNKRERQLHILA